MTNKEITLEALKNQGKTMAQNFRDTSIAEEYTGTQIIEDEHLIPTWREGQYNTVGAPVKYNGQVYKVWQVHDSTGNPDWNPELAVSLFDICHTKDPLKAKPYRPVEGARGLYQTDECMIWTDGEVHRSKMDNNSYTPETYPDGWEKAFPASEEEVPAE